MGTNNSFFTLPRVSISCWYYSSETRNAIQAIENSRQLVRKKSLSIEPGGIEAATTQYIDTTAPEVLIVEVKGQSDEIIAQLVNLANTNAQVSNVIVIGSVNDISFYRELVEGNVSAYLLSPPTPDSLLDAIVSIYNDGGAKLGDVVAVIGSSGGVGSSTIAQNVAWLIAERYALNHKTVLVDGDVPFGSGLLNFDTSAEHDLSRAFTAETIDATYINNILVPVSDRLNLLASPASTDRLYPVSGDRVDEIIDAVRRTATIAVFDLPHEWTDWTTHVLQAAREIIVVARPDFVSLQNTRNMIKEIASHRSDVSPPRFVLNTMGMPKRHELDVANFVDALGIQPLAQINHDPRIFSQSMSEGKPLVLLDETCQASQQMDAIAKILTATLNVEQSRVHHSEISKEKAPKGGLGLSELASRLLGRLLNRGKSPKITPAE